MDSQFHLMNILGLREPTTIPPNLRVVLQKMGVEDHHLGEIHRWYRSCDHIQQVCISMAVKKPHVSMTQKQLQDGF